MAPVTTISVAETCDPVTEIVVIIVSICATVLPHGSRRRGGAFSSRHLQQVERERHKERERKLAELCVSLSSMFNLWGTSVALNV